jgi:hypothetical protein
MAIVATAPSLRCFTYEASAFLGNGWFWKWGVDSGQAGVMAASAASFYTYMSKFDERLGALSSMVESATVSLQVVSGKLSELETLWMESRERIHVEPGRLLAKSAGPLFGLRGVLVQNKGRTEAEEAKRRKLDRQEKTLGRWRC